jgi:hypothetical protein
MGHQLKWRIGRLPPGSRFRARACTHLQNSRIFRDLFVVPAEAETQGPHGKKPDTWPLDTRFRGHDGGSVTMCACPSAFAAVTRAEPVRDPSGSYHPCRVLAHPPHRTAARLPTRTLPAIAQSLTLDIIAICYNIMA